MSTRSVAFSQFALWDPSLLRTILGNPRSRFVFLQGLVNIILSYELLVGEDPLLAAEVRELLAVGLWALTLMGVAIPATFFIRPCMASGLVVVDTVLVTASIHLSGNGSAHLYLVFFLLMLVAASVRGLTLMLSLSLLLSAGYGLLLYQGVLVSGTISAGHVLGIPVLLIMAVFYGLTLETVAAERAQRIALSERVGELQHEEASLRQSRDGLLSRTWRMRHELGRLSRAVTAGRQREEDLQLRLARAHKMEAIARLAGVVARDFDALLRVIGVQTSELLRKAGDREDVRRHAERVLAAGDRASVLTSQLQQFSHREAFQQEAVPLNAVLQDLKVLLRTLLTREVDLALRLDPSVRSVKGDRGQLELLVMHLVANARDAMPRGGRIVLDTRRVRAASGPGSSGAAEPHRFVRLAVSDTGCGMTAEVEARLFEPFFTTKESANGQGLATVYGIVTRCGGRIRVRTGPGRGTRCEVFLQEVGAGLMTLEERSQRPNGPRYQTVLLVDEEELSRKLTAGTLQRHGYDVLEARTAVEALLVGQRCEGSIDLVLCPTLLHDLSGRELTDRLAQEHPGLKVVYVSGYSDTVALGHEAGGAGFLRRPFSQKEVMGKVDELMGCS